MQSVASPNLDHVSSGTGSALARPPVVCFFQPLPLLPSATNSAHIEVLVCLMTNQSSAEYFELCGLDLLAASSVSLGVAVG